MGIESLVEPLIKIVFAQIAPPGVPAQKSLEERISELTLPQKDAIRDLLIIADIAGFIDGTTFVPGYGPVSLGLDKLNPKPANAIGVSADTQKKIGTPGTSLVKVYFTLFNTLDNSAKTFYGALLKKLNGTESKSDLADALTELKSNSTLTSPQKDTIRDLLIIADIAGFIDGTTFVPGYGPVSLGLDKLNPKPANAIGVSADTQKKIGTPGTSLVKVYFDLLKTLPSNVAETYKGLLKILSEEPEGKEDLKLALCRLGETNSCIVVDNKTYGGTQNQPAALEITGKNLTGIKAIKIVAPDKKEIILDGTTFEKNNDKIKLTFTPDQAGSYQIILLNIINEEAGKVTFSSSPPVAESVAPPAKPKVTDISASPNPATVDYPTELIITGSGLNRVEMIKIVYEPAEKEILAELQAGACPSIRKFERLPFTYLTIKEKNDTQIKTSFTFEHPGYYKIVFYDNYGEIVSDAPLSELERRITPFMPYLRGLAIILPVYPKKCKPDLLTDIGLRAYVEGGGQKAVKGKPSSRPGANVFEPPHVQTGLRVSTPEDGIPVSEKVSISAQAEVFESYHKTEFERRGIKVEKLGALWHPDPKNHAWLGLEPYLKGSHNDNSEDNPSRIIPDGYTSSLGFGLALLLGPLAPFVEINSSIYGWAKEVTGISGFRGKSQTPIVGAKVELDKISKSLPIEASGYTSFGRSVEDSPRQARIDFNNREVKANETEKIDTKFYGGSLKVKSGSHTLAANYDHTKKGSQQQDAFRVVYSFAPKEGQGIDLSYTHQSPLMYEKYNVHTLSVMPSYTVKNVAKSPIGVKFFGGPYVQSIDDGKDISMGGRGGIEIFWDAPEEIPPTTLVPAPALISAVPVLDFDSLFSGKTVEQQLQSIQTLADDSSEEAIKLLNKVANQYGGWIFKKDLDDRVLFSAVSALIRLEKSNPKFLVKFAKDHVDKLGKAELLQDFALILAKIQNRNDIPDSDAWKIAELYQEKAKGTKVEGGEIKIEDGIIKSITLLTDIELEISRQIIKFAKNKEVGFDSFGNLEYGTLAEPAELEVKGQKIKFEDQIKFYHGQVASGTLAKRTEIAVGGQLINFESGYITFRNGNLTSGTLVIDTLINDILYNIGTSIYFYEDGSVESGTLAMDRKFDVNGRKFTLRPLSLVQFYPDGKLKKIVPKNNEIQIGNLKVKADEEFRFDKDGKTAEDYLNEGNAKHNANQFEEAIAAYTVAIELYPNYAGAYYGLSLAESKLGKYNDAATHYDRACELNPLYENKEKPATAPAAPVAPAAPAAIPVSATFNRSDWKGTAYPSGGGAPNYALDGLPNTRWSTGKPMAPDQWFMVDMGKEKTFNKIVLDTEGSKDDYPREYEVFASNDSTNWGSAIASGTGAPITTITFSSQKAQYIKVVQSESADKWWSIHEFNVFNEFVIPLEPIIIQPPAPAPEAPKAPETPAAPPAVLAPEPAAAPAAPAAPSGLDAFLPTPEEIENPADLPSEDFFKPLEEE